MSWPVATGQCGGMVVETGDGNGWTSASVLAFLRIHILLCGCCAVSLTDLKKIRVTFIFLNKFIKKLDSKIFSVILIMYHKY